MSKSKVITPEKVETKKKVITKKEQAVEVLNLVQVAIKKIGSNIIANFGDEKYSRKASKEEAEVILKKAALYNKRPNDKSKTELIKLLSPVATKQKEEIEKVETKIKGLKKLVKKEEEGKTKEVTKVKATVHKEVDKSTSEGKELLSYTKKGVAMLGFENIVMPQLLVDKITLFLKENISIRPLLNFWSLCLLNPNEIARTRLFEYLSRHKFIITPSGYFVTYRMVKKTNDKNVFTDARTHTFKIKIGEAVSIPRSECDEDGSRDCSKGLHVGSPDFIGIKKGDGYGNTTTGQIGTGYSGYQDHTAYGDQPIIAFVNPMHVVSIPNSETRKLRCCEYFPFKLTTPNEVIQVENSDYHIYENDYKKVELEQLMASIGKDNLKEYSNDTTSKAKSKLDEQLKNLTIGQDKITSSLDLKEIKAIVLNRVKLLTERAPVGVQL